MEGKYIVGPHQLSFDITNKCNLRCLHCYNCSGDNYQMNNELSDEEVIDFIESLKSVKLVNFCICGGEPLIRKNLVYEIISRLKKYECANIAMVSNGFFLDYKTMEKLIESGLTRIQISLDGINAASHNFLRNSEMAFDAAINALDVISHFDISSAVAFTPTRYNIAEIIKIKNLLIEKKLNCKLRVQPLMIMGRASCNTKSIAPSFEQYKQLVQLINESNEEDHRILIEWGDPIDHLIRFSEGKIHVPFSMIKSNGDIVPDAYIPFVLGNIRKHSFLEYWESGLNNIWKSRTLSRFARSIRDTWEMDIDKNLLCPPELKGNGLFVDICDDKNAISKLDLIY